jgi:hypothetical protein
MADIIVLDLVRDVFTTLQQEAATYPQNVQIWMKVMAGSFLASIVFFYAKTGARWILAAFVLNVLGLVIGKILFPEASRTVIGTYVHILFWPAILFAVWRSARQLSFSRGSNSMFDWAYIGWLGWACLVMAVSLFFDFRNLMVGLDATVTP